MCSGAPSIGEHLHRKSIAIVGCPYSLGQKVDVFIAELCDHKVAFSIRSTLGSHVAGLLRLRPLLVKSSQIVAALNYRGR